MTIENKTITIRMVSIVAFIGIIFTGTMAYANTLNRVENIEGKQKICDKVVTQLVDRTNNNDIVLAQIQTQLSSIQTTLTEVKTKLFK